MLAFESLTPKDLLEEITQFIRDEAHRVSMWPTRNKLQAARKEATQSGMNIIIAQLSSAGILPANSALRQTPVAAPQTTSEINTQLLGALRALLNWGRDNTSPRDANSPHDLLVTATKVIDEADKLKPAQAAKTDGKGYFSNSGGSLSFVLDFNFERIATPDGTMVLLPCEKCHANYWLPRNVVAHTCDDCTKLQAAKTFEDWKAFHDEDGYADGYYALIDGALFVIPMDANGLMDASDPIEVDFNGIDPDDAIKCRKVEAELKAGQ
jgi:hypothetical protein